MHGLGHPHSRVPARCSPGGHRFPEFGSVDLNYDSLATGRAHHPSIPHGTKHGRCPRKCDILNSDDWKQRCYHLWMVQNMSARLGACNVRSGEERQPVKEKVASPWMTIRR